MRAIKWLEIVTSPPPLSRLDFSDDFLKVPLMLYERIFRAFEAADLHYVIVGGMAVNLHGYDRMTGDLDIVIALTDEGISRFITAVKALGMIPRVPVNIDDFAQPQKRHEWIHEKNMKVFSVSNPKNPMEHVDVMISNIIDFETLYRNSVLMSADDLHLRIASIPDLIKLKQHAGRERDLIDIKALQRIERFKKDE